MLYVYKVQICTFIVPRFKMAIFLTDFVPQLVYKVYKMEHFSITWHDLPVKVNESGLNSEKHEKKRLNQ